MSIKKLKKTSEGQGLRLTVVFQIILDTAKDMGKKAYPAIAEKEKNTYEWVQIDDDVMKTALRDIIKHNILTPLQSPKLIKMKKGLRQPTKNQFEEDPEYETEIYLDTWHSNPLFSTAARNL